MDLAYNVHGNDLLYTMSEIAHVYNYADDNIFCYCGRSTEEVVYHLKSIADLAIEWYNNNYMKVNADKFQLMILGSNNENVHMNIQNNTICSEPMVKLLGVTIDSRLNFNHHVSELCKKAGKQLNVLRRLSNVLNVNGKMQLYKTFIVSHFNYCNIICHLCGDRNTLKIEKIQERGLRFIFNDFQSRYKELLLKASMYPLYLKRIKNVLIEIFKICQHSCPAYLNDLFSIKDVSYDLRNEVSLQLPKFKSIKYGKNSLRYIGVQYWNMSKNVSCEFDIKDFKLQLNSWNVPECNCSTCTLCKICNM